LLKSVPPAPALSSNNINNVNYITLFWSSLVIALVVVIVLALLRANM
jgi:hypothetical protein